MSVKAIRALCPDEFAPSKVQLVPGLLDKIARLVLDGYCATSHGGLEIGGVLFGHRQSNAITAEEFRPLICDHSLGPRFILSESDELCLRDLLRAPEVDPDLRGLEVVGWYCSHTRSELELLDREILLHNSCFAHPSQFVLIFKPRDRHSVIAGIFSRNSGLVLDRHRPAEILELPARRTPAGGIGQVVNGTRPAPRSMGPSISVKSDPMIASTRNQSSKHRFRPGKKTAFAAVATGVIALCAGAWRYAAVAQLRPSELAVTVRPDARNFLLSWRSNLAKATRAHVDIVVPGSSQHLNITDIFQPSGVLLFPRKAGDVHATLTVQTPDGVIVRHADFSEPVAETKAPVPPLAQDSQPKLVQNPSTQEVMPSRSALKPTPRRHSRRRRHTR